MLVLQAFLWTSVPVVKTGCEDGGICSYVVQIPHQPMTIQGGDEDFVLRRVFAFVLPEQAHCTQIRTFIGLDSGDRGEFDIGLVTTGRNFQVLDRSYHRHESYAFESWVTHYVDVTAQRFDMLVLGRVTGQNSDFTNPNFGLLVVRYHVGMKLLCTPVEDPDA